MSGSLTTGPCGEENPPLRVWGLSAERLASVYWASFGIEAITQGCGTAPQHGADLYLLVASEESVLFDVTALHRRLLWNGADLTLVSLTDEIAPDFSERVEMDGSGRVVRIRRHYGRSVRPIARAALTTSRELAHSWAQCADEASFWRSPDVARAVRDEVAVPGRCLRSVASDRAELSAFINEIVRTVSHPDRLVDGVVSAEVAGVYRAGTELPNPEDRCYGAVWIGSSSEACMRPPIVSVGPAFVPDSIDRPPARIRPIAEIFAPDSPSRAERAGSPRWAYLAAKRLFDVVFSIAVLALVSPVLFITCILIALEDGFPVHFYQLRESLGGREFRCWKLRSMRRNAEAMVAELQSRNQSDGPQVNIKDDPRVTRVGRIIRKLQIDEFPQFMNVLLGDMSVVGPRPSPRKENQFCPAWRETRLSVRPGITGLWQVMRTRAPGKDFQEWIRYDTEYVERMGFGLDLWIIWRTVVNLVTGGRKPGQEP